jgi:hypothetical protein
MYPDPVFPIGKIRSPQFNTRDKRRRWQVLADSDRDLNEMLRRHVRMDDGDWDTAQVLQRNRRTADRLGRSFESRFRINSHTYLRIITWFGGPRAGITVIEECSLNDACVTAGRPG